MSYHADVSIDLFKRFALPAKDLLVRESDYYYYLYTKVRDEGFSAPLLCYDLVNVDLDNPPAYRNRAMWGLLIVHGNILWLVYKDLGYTELNAVVVTVDYGDTAGNLFLGTNLGSSTNTPLSTVEEISAYFPNYVARCSESCLSLDFDGVRLGVYTEYEIVGEKEILTLSEVEYAGTQRTGEEALCYSV